jgi:hypothetical protein
VCAIAKCNGIWVAVHARSKLILAVGGRGSSGRKRAWKEARMRQLDYGPPGPIPVIEATCKPIRKAGPAANRIRKELACMRRGGDGKRCLLGPEPKIT